MIDAGFDIYKILKKTKYDIKLHEIAKSDLKARHNAKLKIRAIKFFSSIEDNVEIVYNNRIIIL